MNDNMLPSVDPRRSVDSDGWWTAAVPSPLAASPQGVADHVAAMSAFYADLAASGEVRVSAAVGSWVRDSECDQAVSQRRAGVDDGRSGPV